MTKNPRASNNPTIAGAKFSTNIQTPSRLNEKLKTPDVRLEVVVLSSSLSDF
jgi:hypothetical protein